MEEGGSLPGAGRGSASIRTGELRPCGVGRAPSFFHRHRLLMQSLIFTLRSFEVFLPGLLSSRQNFLCLQLVVDRKASSPPSVGRMHMNSCKDPCLDFGKIWIQSQKSLQPLQQGAAPHEGKLPWTIFEVVAFLAVINFQDVFNRGNKSVGERWLNGFWIF